MWVIVTWCSSMWNDLGCIFLQLEAACSAMNYTLNISCAMFWFLEARKPCASVANRINTQFSFHVRGCWRDGKILCTVWTLGACSPQYSVCLMFVQHLGKHCWVVLRGNYLTGKQLQSWPLFWLFCFHQTLKAWLYHDISLDAQLSALKNVQLGSGTQLPW